MIHTLKADRYSVSPQKLDVGTKGSWGNDYIKLSLSPEWDGLTVKISFYPSRSQPVVAVYGGDKVAVPAEVYDYGGDTKVVISGETEERVMISLPFTLKTDETLKPANTPASVPMPDEFAQIYGYMQGTRELAQQLADRSAASAGNAAASAKSSEESASAAEKSSEDANTYMTRAESAAQNAENSAKASGTAKTEAQAAVLNAKDYADKAESAKNGAVNAESGAKSAAVSASSAATSADSSAQNAQASASEAKAAAASSSSSEANAKTSEQSAETKANEASGSANSAASSASAAEKAKNDALTLRDEAIANINSVKDTAASEIENAKNAAVAEAETKFAELSEAEINDIQTAGTEQRQAVENTGRKQVEAVKSSAATAAKEAAEAASGEAKQAASEAKQSAVSAETAANAAIEAKERAESAESSAKSSADRADADASSAAKSSQNANNYSTVAVNAASAAANAANSASRDAADAEIDANRADEANASAKAAASAAAISAKESSDGAVDSKASANAAAKSAANAAESAAEAEKAKNDAQTLRDTAVLDVNTARDAAVRTVQEAQTSAVGVVERAESAAVETVNKAADTRIDEINQSKLGAVRYDDPQTLNRAQKEQARANVGAASAEATSRLSEEIVDEEKRAISRENEIEALFTAPTQEAVNAWLTEHPEATTTVQDRSLTINKMVVGTLGYISPEMFGAKGDGVTDDTAAIASAINALEDGMTMVFTSPKYLVVPVKKTGHYGLSAIGFLYKKNVTVDFNNAEIAIPQINDNSQAHHCVYVSHCENCTFKNGIFIGELDEHVFPDGKTFAETADASTYNIAGFAINSSSDIVAENITAHNWVAAPIHVGGNPKSDNVKLVNCIGYHSHYHVIVVEGADNVILDGCKAYDANTNRNFGCAIDIEGVSTENMNEHIVVRNCEFGDAESTSLNVHKCRDVIIHDSVVSGKPLAVRVCDELRIYNNVIKNRIRIANKVPIIDIKGNYITSLELEFTGDTPQGVMFITVRDNIIESSGTRSAVTFNTSKIGLTGLFCNNTILFHDGDFDCINTGNNNQLDLNLSQKITFVGNRFMFGSPDAPLTNSHNWLFSHHGNFEYIDNLIEVYFSDDYSRSEVGLFYRIATSQTEKLKLIGNKIRFHNAPGIVRLLWDTTSIQTDATEAMIEANSNDVFIDNEQTQPLVYVTTLTNMFNNTIAGKNIRNILASSVVDKVTRINNILNNAIASQ